MNFISAFDELNKLYEVEEHKVLRNNRKLKESLRESLSEKEIKYIDFLGDNFSRMPKNPSTKAIEELFKNVPDSVYAISVADIKGVLDQCDYKKQVTSMIDSMKAQGFKTIGDLANSLKEVKESLTESDEEILVDEEPIGDDEVTAAEEPVEDTETVDVNDYVLECSKCGALVIKAIKEVTEDEESGLANVGEECAYCEASDGFKILGTFAPYEEVASKEDSNDEDTIEVIDDEELIEESLLTEGKIKDSIKKIATRLGADGATVMRSFAELVSELIQSSTLLDAAEHVENKAVLKALQSGNDKVLNTTTKDEIEDLIADIEDYKKEQNLKKENNLSVLVVKYADSKKWDSDAISSDINKLKEFEKKVKENNGDLVLDTKIVDFKTAKKMTGEDRITSYAVDLDKEDTELEELFDANIDLGLSLDGGQGNDVSVLGTGLGEAIEEDEELEEGIFDRNKKQKQETPATKQSPYADTDYVVISFHPASGRYMYVQATPPVKSKADAEREADSIARSNRRDRGQYEVVTYGQARRIVGRPFKEGLELEEGVFDKKKNSAEMNNARRAFESEVKLVTDSKTLSDIANELASSLLEAIQEYRYSESEQGKYTTDKESLARVFDSKAKIVLKRYEETIKSLKKPINFVAPASVIKSAVNEILGSYKNDSSIPKKVADYYSVLNKVSKIEADKKIKVEALKKFYEKVLYKLNSDYQTIKKKPTRTFFK
jgi:hypothetical protein